MLIWVESRMAARWVDCHALQRWKKFQLGKKSWAVNSGNERISGKQIESRGGRTVLAKKKGFPTSEVEVEDHPRDQQES